MPSPFKNIAIVGAGSQSSSPGRATASLGSYILTALLRHPEFNVTIITRESSKAILPNKQKVIKVPDSYPEDELVDAFRGQDVVILNLAVGIQDPSQRLIDAAGKAGVKRIIPSDYGAAANEKSTAVFPFAAKGAVILDYLAGKEGTGLTWTSVKCGIFFDYSLGNGFLGYDIPNHKATIWDDGTYRFSTSTREQIAEAVVKVLQHPEETKNKNVFVSSFSVSMSDILASFEKATEAKWEVEHVKTSEMIAAGRKMMAEGNMMLGIANLAKAVSFSSGYGADFEAAGVLENEMLGLEKENLDDVVARSVQKAR